MVDRDITVRLRCVGRTMTETDDQYRMRMLKDRQAGADEIERLRSQIEGVENAFRSELMHQGSIRDPLKPSSDLLEYANQHIEWAREQVGRLSDGKDES